MAVNLHTKYASAIEQSHTLNSLIAGKLSRQFDFTGVNTIKLSTVVTQALADYSRSTGFATAVEVSDTVQDFPLAVIKSFNLKIDGVNASDQSGIKASGPIMNAQMKEQVTPFFDKNALAKIAYQAGKSIILGAAASKANIIASITAARTHFTDNLIPEENRYIFLRSDLYAFVLQSAEFLAVDTSVGDISMKGVVGKVAGFWVVETPFSYMATKVSFIAIHKDSAIDVLKLDVARIIDSEDFVGKKLQGLFYGDAFVVGAKAQGVYVALDNGSTAEKVATPTATQGTSADVAKYTLASGTSGSTIKYTLDGSDPRYSASAVSVATGTVITLAAAVTGAKFVATKASMLFSEVLTQDCPIT